MNKARSASNNSKNSQLDEFRIRLNAHLFNLFIFIGLAGERIYFNAADSSYPKLTHMLYLITIGLSCTLTAIIGVEYLLYIKLKAQVLKYVKLVDAALITFFLAEWMVTLALVFFHEDSKGQSQFRISLIFGVTSFSWRSLIQIIIIRRWQLRIFAPLCVYIFCIVMAIRREPESISFILVKSFTQIAYMALIFYFEERMRFRLSIINLQQGTWLEINEFILNNIPENIAIFNMDGNVRFVSDQLKQLTHKYGYSDDVKTFFKEIEYLSQQDESSSTIYPPAVN